MDGETEGGGQQTTKIDRRAFLKRITGLAGVGAAVLTGIARSSAQESQPQQPRPDSIPVHTLRVPENATPEQIRAKARELLNQQPPTEIPEDRKNFLKGMEVKEYRRVRVKVEKVKADLSSSSIDSVPSRETESQATRLEWSGSPTEKYPPSSQQVSATINYDVGQNVADTSIYHDLYNSYDPEPIDLEVYRGFLTGSGEIVSNEIVDQNTTKVVYEIDLVKDYHVTDSASKTFVRDGGGDTRVLLPLISVNNPVNPNLSSK